MHPLVSVLIPCYNAERYLREAIESALAQTHPNVEVVVIDDGSTDSSVDILRSFGDRIRWESTVNQGACAARNRAFTLSSGEFIQFLDADDKLAPTKLEKQLPLLINDEADMVLCDVGLFGDGYNYTRDIRPHPIPLGDPFLYFAKYPISTLAPLHRRFFFQRSGGFWEPLRRGQEYELHLRMACLSPRLAMVEEILVWARVHSGERITQRSLNHNEHFAQLAHISDFMISTATASRERLAWIASPIFSVARAAYRNRDVELAERAYQYSLTCNPEVVNDVPWPARHLFIKYGIHAERYLSAVRPAASVVRSLMRTLGKSTN